MHLPPLIEKEAMVTPIDSDATPTESDTQWTCEDSDHWSTPASVWRDILNWVPFGTIIWDPCWNEGRSKIYLEDLGYTHVVAERRNLFRWSPPCDVIVTNPPFSTMELVLAYLFAMNKPMVLLLPSKIWSRPWFRDLVAAREVKIANIGVPIKFIKNGTQAKAAIMESIWVLIDIQDLYHDDNRKKRNGAKVAQQADD